jgi:hypothetical protein
MKTIPKVLFSVRTPGTSTFQCTVLRMEVSYFTKKNCLACIVHNHQAPGTSVSERWTLQRVTSRLKHYVGRGQWYKRRFNWQCDDSRTLGGAVHTGCIMEQQKSTSPYAGRMEGHERHSVRIRRSGRLKNLLSILYEMRDSEIVVRPRWLCRITKIFVVPLSASPHSQSSYIWKTRVQFPVAKDVCLLLSVHIDSEAHPASYLVGTRTFFPWGVQR